MDISEKIANLTNVIMKKAEDIAEDQIVSAEIESENLVSSLQEKLLLIHRQKMREAVENASKEYRKAVASSEFAARQHQLFQRQRIVLDVQKQLYQRCLELKNDPGLTEYLIELAARGVDAVSEKEVVIHVSIHHSHCKEQIALWLRKNRAEVCVKIVEDAFDFGIRVTDLQKRKTADFTLSNIMKSAEEQIRSRVESCLKEKYAY